MTPAMANATLRRFKSPKSLPTGLAACGGMDGRLIHCQARSSTTMGVSAQKTPRQPINPPT